MSGGRITKLNVNIQRGQTYITYANKSTRIVVNNPSGHVFRHTGIAGYRSCGDSARQAKIFLQRHFAPNGSLRQTPSMRELLARLPLEQYETDEIEDIKQEQPKILYTCDLAEFSMPEPKRATICVRSVEHLDVRDLPWHLHTCKWSYYDPSELEKANCYCQEIKETMENVEELVRSAESNTEQPAEGMKNWKSILKTNSKSQTMSQPKENINCQPDINTHIQNLNLCLQTLNSLLAKQNQFQIIE